MGIKLQEAHTADPIVYDRVHLLQLRIEQDLQIMDSDPSMYTVMVRWRYYGVDSEGKRHYREVIVQKYEDFLALVKKEAIKGNLTLYNTFKSVEEAVGVLISLKTGIKSTIT